MTVLFEHCGINNDVDGLTFLEFVLVSEIGLEGVSTAQMTKIQHRKAFGSTFAIGSGGSAGGNTASAVSMIQPGGIFVTPTATMRYGDTTPMAVGSGTIVSSRSETIAVLNGYQFLPNSDEDRPVVAGTTSAGAGYAVNQAALASALTYDATLVWEELF